MLEVCNLFFEIFIFYVGGSLGCCIFIKGYRVSDLFMLFFYCVILVMDVISRRGIFFNFNIVYE